MCDVEGIFFIHMAVRGFIAAHGQRPWEYGQRPYSSRWGDTCFWRGVFGVLRENSGDVYAGKLGEKCVQNRLFGRFLPVGVGAALARPM